IKEKAFDVGEKRLVRAEVKTLTRDLKNVSTDPNLFNSTKMDALEARIQRMKGISPIKMEIEELVSNRRESVRMSFVSETDSNPVLSENPSRPGIEVTNLSSESRYLVQTSGNIDRKVADFLPLERNKLEAHMDSSEHALKAFDEMPTPVSVEESVKPNMPDGSEEEQSEDSEEVDGEGEERDESQAEHEDGFEDDELANIKTEEEVEVVPPSAIKVSSGPEWWLCECFGSSKIDRR
ncbi:hypothetical protein U1Q18_001695, partial [Sarracenia purpurea var. burkii]